MFLKMNLSKFCVFCFRYLIIFSVLGDFHSRDIDEEEMFFTERGFGLSNVLAVTKSLLFD
jgi:hypothetical protein